jgi:hypothetical protein
LSGKLDQEATGSQTHKTLHGRKRHGKPEPARRADSGTASE